MTQLIVTNLFHEIPGNAGSLMLRRNPPIKFGMAVGAVLKRNQRRPRVAGPPRCLGNVGPGMGHKRPNPAVKSPRFCSAVLRLHFVTKEKVTFPKPSSSHHVLRSRAIRPKTKVDDYKIMRLGTKGLLPGAGRVLGGCPLSKSRSMILIRASNP